MAGAPCAYDSCHVTRTSRRHIFRYQRVATNFVAVAPLIQRRASRSVSVFRAAHPEQQFRAWGRYAAIVADRQEWQAQTRLTGRRQDSPRRSRRERERRHAVLYAAAAMYFGSASARGPRMALRARRRGEGRTLRHRGAAPPRLRQARCPAPARSRLPPAVVSARRGSRQRGVNAGQARSAQEVLQQ